MLPKLLPSYPPAFLSFHDSVISMKPTGVMVVSPIRSCNGAVADSDCGGAGTGPSSRGAGPDAAGDAAGGTIMGVVAAIRRSAGVLRWPAAAGDAAPACSRSLR